MGRRCDGLRVGDKMKSIRGDQRDAADIIKKFLAADGVVVLPTDTLYGFSTLLSSGKGHERIGVLKQTDAERNYLYLASSTAMIERYIESWGCGSCERFEEIWPAPLTAVFGSGERCPERVGGTIAFRIPELEFLRNTIEVVGEPIASTSINSAGGPPLDDIGEIERRFGGAVDLIVTGVAPPGGAPSTLIDFTGRAPVILRKGSYDWDEGVNPSK